MLRPNPVGEVFRRAALVQIQPVRLEHVAENGQSLLGLGGGLFRRGGGLQPDHVAALASADLNIIQFLQLLDKVGE